MQSDQQLLVMEEAQSSNSYIQARGEAIDAIERTIGELGGIFGQLAQMVSEQSEMVQRIDTNTEDVVDNVQGAQRELMKYWTRVSSNRWLIAKMFGVLMVIFPFLASLLPRSGPSARHCCRMHNGDRRMDLAMKDRTRDPGRSLRERRRRLGGVLLRRWPSCRDWLNVSY